MEPSSLSMPFCLALLFILLSLFCLTAMKKKPSSPKLPPGPPKLPIVGNLHQLTNHPHRALRDLALKHGSLMYLKLGQIPTLVVSSRSMAEALMKTHDYNFASRPSLTTGNHLLYNCTDIAFAPAGAYWRTIRKICVQELLSVKRVESFSAVREEEVGRLVRAVESSEGAIDLNKLFLSHTIDVICRVAFGRRYDEGGPSEVERLFRERTVLLGGFNFGDLFPSVEWLDLVSGLRRRMRRAFEEIDEFLEHVLEDHRGGTAETQNQRDLVDVLLQLQKDASLDLPLSDQNLKAVLTASSLSPSLSLSLFQISNRTVWWWEFETINSNSLKG
ncbi:hypothetical protein AMTR_s00166p00058240 [Amborella trichopoda]|uniref:Cytochrome P450 n=1 Tax=Amborella trichopoda TaxID=13333 RepID=W1PRR2_AMBTC|nr:hypothetical protein AMTR_s00166p00058240 [Amborella trichopoda]